MAQKSQKESKQIAVYPSDELRKKIQAEAEKRRRKLGPTVLEILLEYFARQGA